jgi:hypothetical protein
LGGFRLEWRLEWRYIPIEFEQRSIVRAGSALDLGAKPELFVSAVELPGVAIVLAASTFEFGAKPQRSRAT